MVEHGRAVEWLSLTVACPCGVVFGRWVTPEDAEVDQLPAAGLNWALPQRHPEVRTNLTHET
jgi:hypothetical protein